MLKKRSLLHVCIAGLTASFVLAGCGGATEDTGVDPDAMVAAGPATQALGVALIDYVVTDPGQVWARLYSRKLEEIGGVQANFVNQRAQIMVTLRGATLEFSHEDGVHLLVANASGVRSLQMNGDIDHTEQGLPTDVENHLTIAQEVIVRAEDPTRDAYALCKCAISSATDTGVDCDATGGVMGNKCYCSGTRKVFLCWLAPRTCAGTVCAYPNVTCDQACEDNRYRIPSL